MTKEIYMMYYPKILAFISLCFFSIIAGAQTLFTKYEGNPVLRVGHDGSWESKQVSHPRILFDGELYRMWYAGNNDTCRQIGYATSADGLTWAKYPGNPILRVGPRGAIDDHVVSPGAVVYDGTNYHMYYTARSYTNTGVICHAISSDGISWTKDDANNPVLKRGDPGWWDDYGLSAGPVLKQGKQWKMWYNGFRSDTRWQSGIATSSDGINWIKDTLHNPLFESGEAGTWDEYEQWIADVLPDSSYYEAFYFGNTKQRAIGYAASKDGIAWGKYGGNPILTTEHSTDDKEGLFQSCVVKERDVYKIWYRWHNCADLFYTQRSIHARKRTRKGRQKLCSEQTGSERGEGKQERGETGREDRGAERDESYLRERHQDSRGKDV
ncbi:MAG: hypothetical protein QME58_04100 [Bacteroidota bacterium]|nr:hypothetical protein [Bacteroidota bacterium]